MTDLSGSLLAQLSVLLSEYSIVKAQYPGEGRRKWKLRVAEHFFNLSADEKKRVLQDLTTLSPQVTTTAGFVTDGDPFDEVSDRAPGIGILIRTDYSDEQAWSAFYAKLNEAQEELLSELTSDDAEVVPIEGGEGDNTQDQENEDEDDEDDEDEDSSSPTLFSIINPPTPSFTSNLSNLSALRLLNDVSIRPAPKPPQGAKRIKPPNRLIDHDGWQEEYIGKTIWIYDVKSNVDGCARLVSQKADMYGTATGDSWRARVTHIPELQVNMSSGALSIDFGGLDRWDHNERQRNLQDAIRPIQ